MGSTFTEYAYADVQVCKRNRDCQLWLVTDLLATVHHLPDTYNKFYGHFSRLISSALYIDVSWKDRPIHRALAPSNFCIRTHEIPGTPSPEHPIQNYKLILIHTSVFLPYSSFKICVAYVLLFQTYRLYKERMNDFTTFYSSIRNTSLCYNEFAFLLTYAVVHNNQLHTV